jgi:hypothetical protein
MILLDAAGNEFEDPIPAHTTFEGTVSATSGVAAYDSINNMITWNGNIPIGGSVMIQFCVTLDTDLTHGDTISNQGTVYIDTNLDGIPDLTRLTDWPLTADPDDPTVLIIDLEPPISWLEVTLDPDGYVVPASLFTIYAYDEYSPWQIHYIIDDGTEKVGKWDETVHFQLNELWGYGPGLHTIEYWAVDLQTNEELPHHVEEYVLDDEGPTVSIDFDGPYELTTGGTYQIATTTLIELTAEDNAVGVDHIDYRIGTDGEWTLYDGPFAMPAGSYDVYVAAYDHMNNVGGAHYTLHVGVGAPATVIHLTPGQPTGDAGWYRDTVTVALTATDDFSGIAHVYYRLDGGTWQTYTQPFTLDDGRHTVEYYSVDNAGFAEAVKTKDVLIDLYAPEITVEKPRTWLYIADRAIMPVPGDKPIIIGKITITAMVTDPMTSGVAATKLFVDDEVTPRVEGSTQLRYTFDEFRIGTVDITITTSDVAGNEASTTFKMWVISLRLRTPIDSN